MADLLTSDSIIDEPRRDQAHAKDIAQALLDLRDGLSREGIPFAVIGAIALRRHGYSRHTEDIGIVTTPEGLDRIHERLAGRGIRYATLASLLAFEIASGIWGRRPRDLADAQELIKARQLDAGLAERLPEELKTEFLGLLRASREERDIE
jgi:hypothetical protein